MIDEVKEKVQLFISCANLRDKDFVGKSDPQVRMTWKTESGQVKVDARTEVQKDDLNPKFRTPITMDYFFERKQELLFEVYDIDGDKDKDFLGKASTTMGAIAGSKKTEVTLKLSDKKGFETKSTITIKLDTVAESKVEVDLTFEGINLKGKGGCLACFSSSNFVLAISRKNDTSNEFYLVHTTNALTENNPKWAPFSLNMGVLCQGDPKWPIKLEVQTKSDDDFTTLSKAEVDFETIAKGEKIELSAIGGGPGGFVLPSKCQKNQPEKGFLDYIKEGQHLSLSVAVDFTASNKTPTDPTSNHYVSQSPNQYQMALSTVGNILLNYDSDRRVTAFGFGGIPQWPNFREDKANHCFPLTGNRQIWEVQDLQGLMNGYQNALNNVKLSGPTYFAPLLNQAIQHIQNSPQNIYHLLLILTDGAIHDMNPTKEALIKASELPMSVVIVGVGDADEMQKMVELDSDNGLLSVGGKTAKRDIVQFVRFLDQKYQKDMNELVAAVLKELPKQFIEYQKKK